MELRNWVKTLLILALLLLPTFWVENESKLVASPGDENYLIRVAAKNTIERSRLAKTGVSIEQVGKDFVLAIGNSSEIEAVRKSFTVLQETPLRHIAWGFPPEDSDFHDYDELIVALKALAASAPDLVELVELGRSVEGRIIYDVKITAERKQAQDLPAIAFMGGHHAREHLSIEMPLMLAQYLVDAYIRGDARVRALVDSRVVHIIPVVNPDGAEYDIATGAYRWWRKNRAQHDKDTFGTDLNRNYGYQWGKDGASPNPGSSTFRGPNAFSEPETQAIRDFVEQNENISILLTFHTFSELILYPWGHTLDSIGNVADLGVFEKMAGTMADMNGYTPQQSSDLYVTSGDTTDWAYGDYGIFAFTFELDPESMFDGGFYPGSAYIDRVFNKNLEPALYLIGLSDNPYRAVEAKHKKYGLASPLWDF